VCDSPVGSFDVFGQELGGIAIRGWAFDPNTTDPIDLVVSTNGFIDQVPADESRGDLAAVLPGVGANHGFDLFAGGFEVGSSTAICVVAVNVGTGTNTTLGCKNITMLEPVEATIDPGTGVERTTLALIESADVVSGGVRIRGWAVEDSGSSVASLSFTASAGLGAEAGLGHWVVRSDVNFLAGLPDETLSGFDFVMPAAKIGWSTFVCVNVLSFNVPPRQVMCRTIGT
jgi:hypothetical protein